MGLGDWVMCGGKERGELQGGRGKGWGSWLRVGKWEGFGKSHD